MRALGAYRDVMEARTRPGLVDGMRLRACLVAVTLVAAACSPSNPEPSATSSAAVASSATPSGATPVPTAVPSPTSTPKATSAPVDRPLASSGSVAIVREDGSLWMVGADGAPMLLAAVTNGPYGFPTWSPDGSRVAAIRTSLDEAAIVVFDTERATAVLPPAPVVIFRSGTVGPFYLSWTPDGKNVSFLANEGDGLALRIAPADGSAPLDGSGPGAVIRTGSPFYFDWIDSRHLLAHIGTGTDAFLGEIDKTGAAVGKATKSPGDFRSADVSGDGRFLGFVRAGTNGADAVVVAARDGSGEASMPVFGLTAVDFGPTDDTLASIGATEPTTTPLGVPVGPLRLLDAQTGMTRTLLDGPVVSFAWAPDGKTIAAIRLVQVAGGSNASTASPTTSPAPNANVEVRLTFVDVASGKIRSESEVAPGQRYVSALMTYFDQYALSHHLWAPDSSSILLPQVAADGSTRVDVVFANGDDPVSLDGEIGFWSP